MKRVALIACASKKRDTRACVADLYTSTLFKWNLQYARALDPDSIVVAHISDVLPRQGDEWSDADRDVLPGDGILPLREGIEAIRSTGFDGLWCVEMLGAYHWEWDPYLLAREVKQRADALLQ